MAASGAKSGRVLAFIEAPKGGLFVSDNVLWSGRVTQPNPDANTRGIVELNRLLYSSSELFTTIVPLRDGVAVAMKQ